MLDDIFCNCQHFQECGKYVGWKSEGKYMNKSDIKVMTITSKRGYEQHKIVYGESIVVQH